jgi:hypothetical protein
MVRAMKRAAQRGRSYLVKRTPVDQGQLKASWKTQVTATGEGGDIAASIINGAPHAAIVEEGARPHPVSNEGFYAIFLWAKRHGVVGARRKFQRGGRTRIQGPQQVRIIRGFAFTDADVPTAELALGICRKIQKHGQEATYFVRDSMPALHEMATKELAKAMQKAMTPRRKKGGK